MIRFLAILVSCLVPAMCVLACPARAQGWQGYEPQPADEFTLERLGDDHAYVEYYNADPPNSARVPSDLTNGDLTVLLEVGITQGPETLTVIAPEGWIANPPFIEVIDGEIGRIDLIRGEWHGM